MVDLFSRFVARWYKEGVEVIALTKGSVDKTSQTLEAAEIRRYFEEVRSLSEPKIFASAGDLLYEGLKKHGWVPREQLYVDTSVEAMTSVWLEASGTPRRCCMAHTLRLPENLSDNTANEFLGIVSDRVFMPPAKGTTHVYAVKYNGSTLVDEEDVVDKLRIDGLPSAEAQKLALERLSVGDQDKILAGRPDLVKLLRGEQAAAAAANNASKVAAVAPPSPAPVSPQRAVSPHTSAVMAPNVSTATNNTRTTVQSAAVAAAKPEKSVRTVTLTEVTEGTRVQIGTGPQEGCLGVVMKVVGVGSGGDVRYRVKLDGGESTTWTTKVKGVVEGESRSATTEMQSPGPGMISPAFAALTGQPVPKGKGKGSAGARAPPPEAKPKVEEVEEFQEGTIVEVVTGPQKGKCGTVMKVAGEGKEKKYRVQIEAGGPSSWCPQVKLATRALQKEEVKVKISDLYDIEKKKLGAGAFGSVQKVRNKSTQLVRAMKSCLKPLVKNVDVIWKEVNIMKRLDHPNIIKLYDTFEDHRSVYLIMEICAGGELFNRILEVGRFGEGEAAVVMQHIFRGVFYMHSKRITHRDLKPENFLLTESGVSVDKSGLKIIDFGLSHDFPEEGTNLRTKAGSAYYVSPQVLNASYDHMGDMWSLGVINYILLCGSPPFEGETDPEIFAKIKTGEYEYDEANWGQISQDAKNLIDGLLTFEPKHRTTADQAMKSTWVSKLAPKAVPGRKFSMLENLRAFQSVNTFKKAAMQVVASEMSEGQIKALRETFLALDSNGDGMLSAQELRDGMSKIGLSEVPADLGRIWDALDCKTTGSIDYTEFLGASMDKKTYMQEDVCWAVFRVFDKDGNGKISKEEIAEVLRDRDIAHVAATDIANIVTTIDLNGDGEIDFEEFMKMMRGG